MAKKKENWKFKERIFNLAFNFFSHQRGDSGMILDTLLPYGPDYTTVVAEGIISEQLQHTLALHAEE